MDDDDKTTYHALFLTNDLGRPDNSLINQSELNEALEALARLVCTEIGGANPSDEQVSRQAYDMENFVQCDCLMDEEINEMLRWREVVPIPDHLKETMPEQALVQISARSLYSLLVAATSARYLRDDLDRALDIGIQHWKLLSKAYEAFNDPVLANRTNDRRAAAVEALGLSRAASKQNDAQYLLHEYFRLRKGIRWWTTSGMREERPPMSRNEAIEVLAERNGLEFEAMEQRIRRAGQ